MNNLQKTHLERIENFFNEIELTHLNINDYLSDSDLQDLDFSNAFKEILNILQEKDAFEIDVIYYSNAMQYLTLHDTSLRDSIDLALERGYELKNINSELLASLLATQITTDAFWGYQSEIDEFFENFNVVEFEK